jgi:hypothetical protein
MPAEIGKFPIIYLIIHLGDLHSKIKPWNRDPTHFLLFLEHLEHAVAQFIDFI